MENQQDSFEDIEGEADSIWVQADAAPAAAVLSESFYTTPRRQSWCLRHLPAQSDAQA